MQGLIILLTYAAAMVGEHGQEFGICHHTDFSGVLFPLWGSGILVQPLLPSGGLWAVAGINPGCFS